MNYALILAAGLGTRMKNDVPKQYLKLDEKPILAHSLQPFEASPLIDKVLVTVSEEYRDYCQKEVIDKYNLHKVSLITGGDTRQESVYNALQTLQPKKDDTIIIHDGARPLIRGMDIEKLLDLPLRDEAEGFAPILPLSEDVVKKEDDELQEIIPRSGLYTMQTPMIFDLSALKAAHENAHQKRLRATEDTQIMKENQGRVKLFPGSPYYFKVTYPNDVSIIDRLLMDQLIEDEILISVEAAIEEFKQGRPVIISDSEDRENEGDLCMPSELLTPEIMNMMVTQCRGLVCVCVTPDIAKQVGLKPMAENPDLSVPAFTVTVDAVAKYGVTSGTSVHDRVRTTLALVDDKSTPEDFERPGHVFPLIENKNGLSARQGHTEACIALARIGGFKPSATICEVLNEDGSMARMPQLVEFAKKHKIKITTIDRIIEYAKKNKII